MYIKYACVGFVTERFSHNAWNLVTVHGI